MSKLEIGNNLRTVLVWLIICGAIVLGAIFGTN